MYINLIIRLGRLIVAVEYHEQVLATIIKALLDEGHRDTANLLSGCQITEIYRENIQFGDPYDIDSQYRADSYEVKIGGSSLFCKKYADQNDETKPLVNHFLALALGAPQKHIFVTQHLLLLEFDLDWRVKLLAEADTQQVHNQNSYNKDSLIYSGMRFSSPAEISVAKALDNLGVMYLPNCLARVGSKGNRVNRFPDFLICYQGKWGILEIDGATYHSGTATEDHQRSRLIERHGGIAYFTRYDAKRCQQEPDKVIKEFLEIVSKK